MNLHGIVAGAIGAVNPTVRGAIQTSAGYTTNDDGTRVPAYNPIQTNVPMQVQALQFRDITQLDGLNIEGVQRKIYISGRVDGLIRPENKGGDIITIADGYGKGVWLVACVLEYWPDWCTVAVTQQNGA